MDALSVGDAIAVRHEAMSRRDDERQGRRSNPQKVPGMDTDGILQMQGAFYTTDKGPELAVMKNKLC